MWVIAVTHFIPSGPCAGGPGTSRSQRHAIKEADHGHLEVHNRGATGTIAVGEPDLERGGGFGCYLVDVLAHAWGVSRGDHTVVWVEFICGPPHAATSP